MGLNRIWLQAFGIEVGYAESGNFFIKPPERFSQQVVYLFVFDIVGKLIPIIFTFFCYWSVHKMLTGPYEKTSDEKQPVAPRVLWYSGIQFICFLPGIMADLSGLFGFVRPFQLNLVIYALHHAWGFLNLVVYWFLRPQNRRKQSFESFAFMNEMSSSRTGNETSLSVLSNF